jgi:hypothetical protein
VSYGLLGADPAAYRYLGPRHSCDQGDNLDSYTWTEYDPREGGVQLIKDSLNNVQLTTEFLKVPGGDHGGSWAVRVKGETLDIGKRYDSYLFHSMNLIISSRKTVSCIHYILFWPRGPWGT